jgi:hypothetical protein
MSLQKTLAAGVVALTALATTAPAQADSVSFGIHGKHGGVTFSAGDNYLPAHHWRGRGPYKRHWGYADYRLAPYQVRRLLWRRGFHAIRFTDTYGKFYQARATGPRGARVAMIIRARDGQIVELHRIHRHGHRHHQRRNY